MMNATTRIKSDAHVTFSLGKACEATGWARHPDWRRMLLYLNEELDLPSRTLVEKQEVIKVYLNEETKEYAGSFDFEAFFQKRKVGTRQSASQARPPSRTRSTPPAPETISTSPYSDQQPSPRPFQADSIGLTQSPILPSGDLSGAGSQFGTSEIGSSKSAPVSSGNVRPAFSNPTVKSSSR